METSYTRVPTIELRSMMRRKSVLVTIAFFCAAVRLAQADALTIGSPAPDFLPEKFVQGANVSKLQRGHKYVIEFSGTDCNPCIQFIPHMEELKNKYTQFTFISVFREAEDDIRRFLKSAGASMTTHVACDSTGAIDRLWMRPSGARGIPFVFIVNENLQIAWLGSPEELKTVLPILAKQNSLPPKERIRASLIQNAKLQEMHKEELWEQAQRYRRDTINRLVNQGQHAEAIEAIDKAIETYHDFPDFIDRLRTFKFYEMARVPGTRDAASSLAFDIATDDFNKNDSDFASTLIQHYEAALPENKNKDFVVLALVLLQETSTPNNAADADNQRMIRRNYFSSLAKAYHLLDQPEDAKTSLQNAISIAENQLRERRKSGDHELNIKNSANQLAKLRDRLSKYNKQPIAEERKAPAKLK